MSFADLGLSDELLRAVEDSGYPEPTPIQRQAIPPVLMMRDIIGVAQTGTGKTASFVLPMIDILAQGRSRARMPRSLILAPTRELAVQVSENFVKYGKYHKLSMALLIGGVAFGDQDRALMAGVDVLIATPGRLLDQFERGKILLSGVEIFVIDEADRMLDMGFIPDVERLCSLLPARRQTLLFSATMPAPIKRLADRFMREPKLIEVSRSATTNADITQALVQTTARGKGDTLRRLLRETEVKNAIVFCNRKRDVRELALSLKRHHFKAGQIHGDMEQADRLRELESFRRGDIVVLVASDVAARGLDIQGVSHIFNYDMPYNPEDYVHRIGRTGRAGRTGTAMTLVTPDDAEAVSAVEKLIGQTIPRLVPVPDEPLPGELAPDELLPHESVPDEPVPRRSRAPRRRAAASLDARGAGAQEAEPARQLIPEDEADAGETRQAGEARTAGEAREPGRARRRSGRKRGGATRDAAAPGPAPRGRGEEAAPAPAEPEVVGWGGPVPDFLFQSARG